MYIIHNDRDIIFSILHRHPLFYSWRREDGRDFVPGTKIYGRNRILEIPNAPLEAEGNYICKCVRGTGDSAEKVISLAIEGIYSYL